MPLVYLLTGSSSGFGLQFAHTILSRGDLLIATARNPSSLPTSLTTHPNATILPLDLTSPAPTITRTVAAAHAIHGRIDVLLNNAGYVQIGLLEDLDRDDWQRQFDTNVFGTIDVTKAVLPYMRARRRGTVVVVSSLTGWVGQPAVGCYAASKHALEGAMEALSHEIAPLGIKTLIVEPGRFRTEVLSSKNLKIKRDEAPIPEYAKFYEETLPSIAAESGKQPGDPAKLVEIVLDLVRGEGVAEGRKVPLRVVLGQDAWEEVGGKLKRTLGDMQEWEGVTRSTDVDE